MSTDQSGAAPLAPSAALVETLQEALTDAINVRIEGTKANLLRAVKPLIMESVGRTDEALQDLELSVHAQLQAHSSKLASGAARAEHLGQCLETGVQVRAMPEPLNYIPCDSLFSLLLRLLEPFTEHPER
jgi:hypothetical protein